MKVDNIANSIINVVNGSAVTPANDNAAKKQDAAIIEKDPGAGKTTTEKADKEKLSKAIDVANNAFKEVNVGFKYTLNEKINREIVQVVNTQTGEVIRQFPPDDIINMLERMYDMLGILIDKKM